MDVLFFVVVSRKTYLFAGMGKEGAANLMQSGRFFYGQLLLSTEKDTPYGVGEVKGTFFYRQLANYLVFSLVFYCLQKKVLFTEDSRRE